METPQTIWFAVFFCAHNYMLLIRYYSVGLQNKTSLMQHLGLLVQNDFTRAQCLFTRRQCNFAASQNIPTTQHNIVTMHTTPQTLQQRPQTLAQHILLPTTQNYVASQNDFTTPHNIAPSEYGTVTTEYNHFTPVELCFAAVHFHFTCLQNHSPPAYSHFATA